MIYLLAITLLGCPRPATIAGMDTLVNPASFDVGGAEGAWAPTPGSDLLPLGVWVRVGAVEAFTYVDEAAGPSVRWDDAEGSHVRRIQLEPAGMEVMDRPDTPPWLDAYGPQPIRGSRWGAWRDDPRLAGADIGAGEWSFSKRFTGNTTVYAGDEAIATREWGYTLKVDQSVDKSGVVSRTATVTYRNVDYVTTRGGP